MKSSLRACVALSVVVLSAALLAGCDGKKSPVKTDDRNSPKTEPVVKTDDKTPPDQPTPKKPAVKLTPFEPPKAVELTDVTPQELQAFIEKQRGRVVLVDYWFLGCAPCRAAMPHTIEFSRKHAKDGLVVVTMCVDTLDNRAGALKFLKSKEAVVVNRFASEKLDPDMLTELFAVGDFPYYRLYGPDGKLIQAMKPGGEEAPKVFQRKLDAAVKEALGL